MLAHTAKMVIKSIKNHCRSKKFSLMFKSEDHPDLTYSFEINRDSVMVEQSMGDNSISHYVDNIDLLALPENLSIKSFLEITDDGKDVHSISVKFEAQLFIHLFRLMGDHVFLMLEREGKMIECRYIDKKVFIQHETESEVQLLVTNLYRYHKANGNYNIRLFSPISNSITPQSYTDEVRTTAEILGKDYIFKEEH